MKKARQLVETGWFLFGIIGAFVAAGLLVYAWYLTSRGRSAEHPWLYVTLCPTSIYLMATERLSPVRLGFVYTGIIVSNFLLYAIFYATVKLLVSTVGYLLHRYLGW